MKTEITSNSYEGGKRVEVQKVTYDKSDDLYALANLQRQYERICRQIENSTDEALVKNLQEEKEKLEAKISAMENNIAGYDNS